MTTTDRLDALVRELGTETEDFVAAIAAEEFVKTEEREHPRQFTEWLRGNAIDYCTERLKDAMNRDRARILRRASARLFAEVSANGDEAMADAMDSGLFRAHFVIDPENTRRPLALMTGEDCSFAANTYRSIGKRQMMIGAFLNALAQKVGDKTVSDVMGEEDCERLFRSVTAEEVVPELITA